MHGEYYQGTSLPASLGRGQKTTQTTTPVANKDAMASAVTLVGEDDGHLKKLDSSEKPSSSKSSFLKHLTKKNKSKDTAEQSSSHKNASQKPLREPRMPSWESMAVYASLK